MLDNTCASSNSLSLVRMRLVLALVWVGFATGVLISWPLWAGARVFPVLSVVDFWKSWAAPWDALLVTAVVLLIAVAAWRPQGRGWLWGAFAGVLLLVSQDQVRWQPWVFQYLVMLGLAAAGGAGREASVMAGWRILLIGTYAWGGLHKLGPGFANLYEAAFMAPLDAHWPGAVMKVMRWQGPLIPWIEIAAAAALCFPVTRKAGVLLAAATHAVILMMLGPWGIASNAVVWPWNGVLILMLFVLFWNQPGFGWKGFWVPGFRWAASGVLALVTVTPLLGRVGWWDRYASFQLYSGTDLRFFLVVDRTAAQALPPEYHPYLRPSPVDPAFQELRFVEWSLKELRVPVPAEERLLLALGKKFAGMEVTRQGRHFFYVDYAFLLKERGWDTHRAAAIQEMRSIPPLRKTPPAF